MSPDTQGAATAASPDDELARMARLIIENAREYAFLILEPSGRIITWSAGAERIFHFTTEEAVGMDFANLFVEADQIAGAPALELKQVMAEGRAEDTRWHRRRDGERFWGNGVSMRVDGKGPIVKIVRDETPAKLAEDQRIILLNELNHRIKNTLVIVQSITEQTLRAAGTPTEVRHSLAGRLLALARAHDVLVAESWAGADLATIVTGAVLPHAVRHDRFHIDGPAVRLSARHSVPMALVLHELATNAAKYGALLADQGRVGITWNLAHETNGERRLTLVWRETGGPPATPPTRAGFGSRLFARSFEAVKGRVDLTFASEGLTCVIDLPLSTPDETPMLELPRGPNQNA